MKGAFLVDVGMEEKVLLIDANQIFEFTKCRPGNNCVDYSKKGSELDEKEKHLLKGELIKQESNNKQK